MNKMTEEYNKNKDKNYKIEAGEFSSALAGSILEETLNKGETIEIPSLNMKIKKYDR